MNDYKYLAKFARKRLADLIKFDDIHDILYVIEEAPGYFITEKAKVYHQYTDNMFYLVKPYLNKRNGYMYITLSVETGKKRTFRLHRLVAKACVPNPYNLPVVGHLDNNKRNCKAKNLYWTTHSENTQKAVNDHLLGNAKGFEDSQSIPVVCFDNNGNIIDIYGSITIAHKNTGVSKSTIGRQIIHSHKSNRCGLYFRSLSEYEEHGFIL